MIRRFLGPAALLVLAMSTLTAEGYPFGSVVSYVCTSLGEPVVCISSMAEHTVNATRDRRASVMIAEGIEAGRDPLAAARLTLVGDLDRYGAVPPDLRAAFLERHPNARYYVDYTDFSWWRLVVRSVRYVGGFGHMSWVTVGDYAAAAPDPLKPHAAGIIKHMNDDHADALVAYCQALAGEPETLTAQMLTVDRYGFDVLAISDAGRRAVRIPFGELCDDTTAVRMATIRLLGEARALLERGVGAW